MLLACCLLILCRGEAHASDLKTLTNYFSHVYIDIEHQSITSHLPCAALSSADRRNRVVSPSTNAVPRAAGVELQRPRRNPHAFSRQHHRDLMLAALSVLSLATGVFLTFSALRYRSRGGPYPSVRAPLDSAAPARNGPFHPDNFIRKLSLTAARATSLDDCLNGIATALCTLPDVDACGIFVRRHARTDFMLAAAAAADETLATAMAAVHPNLFSDGTLALDGPRWLSEADPAALPALSKFPDRLRTVLVLPAWWRNQHIASVCLTSAARNTLDHISLPLADSVAATTALAIAAQAHNDSDTRARLHLETLMSTIRDLVFITSPGGSVLYANPSAEQVLQFTRHDFAQMTMDQLCERDAETGTNRTVRELIAGDIDSCRTSLVGQDGTRVPVEMKMIRGPWCNRDSFFFACTDITDRLRHDAALRQSEERLRMIVDLAGVGLIIVDRDGNILFDNNASAKAPDRTQASTHAESGEPQSASFVHRHLAQINRVLQTRSPLQFKTRLSVNNLPLWFDVSIRPFTQTAAQDCVLIMTRNVTEQLSTLAALQVSDHRFRVITENALDLILIFNDSYQVIFASDNAANFTGYSDADLKAKSLADIVHRPEWGKVEVRLRELAEGELPMARIETEFAHRSGRVIPIELIIRQVEWEEHTCSMAFARDISSRRHAEKALRESELLFRSVAERAFDAIVFIDETGRFLFANRRASEITGYSIPELTEKAFLQLIHPSDKERVNRYFINRLSGLAVPSRYETYLIKKNGSFLPVRISIQALQLREQRVFLHIWKDISEKKRFRDEIVKISEWEKNRIGQDLHDSIGQQLAGMGFLADALAMELQQAESANVDVAHQIALNCRKAHQQLRDVVRGLLPLGADETLSSSLERLTADTFKQTQVFCRVRSELDTQNMDPISAAHLLHVAQEAISNAIRHGKAKHIAVFLGSENGSGCMRIEDDGEGFDLNTNPSCGSGLKIMAFRADILRGALTIRRRSSRGMVVRCSFDLAHCFTLPRNVTDDNSTRG